MTNNCLSDTQRFTLLSDEMLIPTGLILCAHDGIHVNGAVSSINVDRSGIFGRRPSTTISFLSRLLHAYINKIAYDIGVPVYRTFLSHSFAIDVISELEERLRAGQAESLYWAELWGALRRQTVGYIILGCGGHIRICCAVFLDYHLHGWYFYHEKGRNHT